MDFFLHELSGRGVGVLLGLLIGAMITWFWAHWKRVRERRSIDRGDARDTIVVALHVIETAEGPGGRRFPRTLRVRSVGQSELDRVVPNGHLASVLLQRAFEVTTQQTLISMEGAAGSYLLETLTGFVCDRVANGPFDHDLYVMAPCCEPAEFAEHQPITILLIAVADLAYFEDWVACREVQVEHASDGARVLTLMELSRRFKAEQAELKRRRAASERTRHAETMYILDLAMDLRVAPIPTKPIPWGRFEHVLKQMNLE